MIRALGIEKQIIEEVRSGTIHEKVKPKPVPERRQREPARSVPVNIMAKSKGAPRHSAYLPRKSLPRGRRA